MITMDADDLRQLLQIAPAANPMTDADTERLTCLLEGEPEVDECATLAGAAAALIERYRRENAALEARIAEALIEGGWTGLDDAVAEMRQVRQERDDTTAKGERQLKMAVQMDAGARENMADALGRPELKTWGEIQEAARELMAERDKAARIIGERMLDRNTPDALPVLSIGGANANGCNVLYRAPEAARFAPGDEVLVGQWRYRVVERWIVGGGADTWGVRIQPLDGAPVQPMGEGLMIAMMRPCSCGDAGCTGPGSEHHQCGGPREACAVPGCKECGAGTPKDWAVPDAPLASLVAALGDEVDDPAKPIASAVALIERLKDDRARHEQRRLDLAEKMSITPATWEAIATHAAIYGLLSTPVLRFALAMQERLDAQGAADRDRGERVRVLFLGANELQRLVDEARPAADIRQIAARVALRAMAIAQTDGDLDSFDAAAEIAAARGKSAD